MWVYIRALEHLVCLGALALGSAWAVKARRRRGQCSPLPQPLTRLLHQLHTTSASLKLCGGHPSVFTDLPADVLYEAPAPSMDMQGVTPGQGISFTDLRGSIHKFQLEDGVTLNAYHTRAGYRRSGDLHDCSQYDVLLSGLARLRMINCNTGREEVVVLKPHDLVIIPPRTPHLFEFLEDSVLIEWWDGPFRAWYYAPYRSVITANPSLQATETMDFGIEPIK